MDLLTDTIAWLTNPSHWTGPNGIPIRIAQHVAITLIVTAIATVLALPLGAWMGHQGRGESSIALTANVIRALPTLGLITVLALWIGIGIGAPLVALVVLAAPSILAATYSGVRAVTPDVVDAARALGHSPAQILTKVELPIALPVIAGGIQTALTQVVATATIAAYVSDVGLGRFIFTGLKSRDYAEMLGGSVLVIILALILSIPGTAVKPARANQSTTRKTLT